MPRHEPDFGLVHYVRDALLALCGPEDALTRLNKAASSILTPIGSDFPKGWEAEFADIQRKFSDSRLEKVPVVEEQAAQLLNLLLHLYQLAVDHNPKCKMLRPGGGEPWYG